MSMSDQPPPPQRDLINQLIPHPINASPSPLAIPELMQLIGSFMDHKTLATSLRVCKDWSRILLPCQWSTVKMIRPHQKGVSPAIHDIARNASLVRKLIIQCGNRVRFPGRRIRCGNLAEIVIEDTGTFKCEQSFVILIQKHQDTLRRFSSKAETSPQFLHAIAGCSRLERLKLDYLWMITKEQWVELYDPLWSRLKALSWTGMIIGDVTPFRVEEPPLDLLGEMSTLLSSTRTADVQDLEFFVDPYSRHAIQCQVLLIVKSPALFRLKWKCLMRQDTNLVSLLLFAIRFTKTTTTTTGATAATVDVPTLGQQLESLYLFPTVFTNKELEELLQSLPMLTSLALPKSSFDDCSWIILKTKMPHYLTTFKELNIQNCNVSGAIVQDILCSMPCLEVLAADTITVTDILNDDRPWVCSSRLRRLAVSILTLKEDKEGDWNGKAESEDNEKEGEARDPQGIVIDRLSTLVNLRILDLNDGNCFVPMDLPKGYRCLHLTLNRGLGILSSLSQLQEFYSHCWFDDTVWMEEEARWAFKHWRNLKAVAGIVLERGATTRLWDVRVHGRHNPLRETFFSR